MEDSLFPVARVLIDEGRNRVNAAETDKPRARVVEEKAPQRIPDPLISC
jgi:hypothetical protein